MRAAVEMFIIGTGQSSPPLRASAGTAGRVFVDSLPAASAGQTPSDAEDGVGAGRPGWCAVEIDDLLVEDRWSTF